MFEKGVSMFLINYNNVSINVISIKNITKTLFIILSY